MQGEHQRRHGIAALLFGDPFSEEATDFYAPQSKLIGVLRQTFLSATVV
jgi:hypothetical protein